MPGQRWAFREISHVSLAELKCKIKGSHPWKKKLAVACLVQSLKIWSPFCFSFLPDIQKVCWNAQESLHPFSVALTPLVGPEDLKWTTAYPTGMYYLPGYDVHTSQSLWGSKKQKTSQKIASTVGQTVEIPDTYAAYHLNDLNRVVQRLPPSWRARSRDSRRSGLVKRPGSSNDSQGTRANKKTSKYIKITIYKLIVLLRSFAGEKKETLSKESKTNNS